MSEIIFIKTAKYKKQVYFGCECFVCLKEFNWYPSGQRRAKP